MADLVVLNHRLEAAVAQFAQRAGGVRMAQHTFGREHNQGLAPVTQRLTAEHVKVLRGGRWLADLYVVFGGELQVTFNASAGVLRALPFIAVRQQHDQTGKQSPFVFASNQKLVDDDLGAVGKVAELCFPQSETVRIVAAESVFKAEY